MLAFNERGVASLDGRWDFFPGDHGPGDLAGLEGDTIEVPALWEVGGYLDLDGPAWYRRRFSLDGVDPDTHWTLHFGAVMDLADVWVNNRHLAHHDNPFTPFEIDVTPVLRQGENEVAVRVLDPPLGDPEHLRMAHGKQGWANHVFPSRPSLYMTYGGIWQPVSLRRHGPVVVCDAFVNGDPDDLVVVVEVENRSRSTLTAHLSVDAVGASRRHRTVLEPGQRQAHSVSLGPTDAAGWRPDRPALHHAAISALVGDGVSDQRVVRFGLRTIRVEGTRLLLNGEPYRMKSALVQGFRAEQLYAEGPRATIEQEVRAAQAMGFNTLRLHIKAFDPTYLDVCDEVGMLLHCDIPIAEPIAHDELGTAEESVVGRRGVEAVRDQIRRDRNHPSVILWSVMNEVCLDRWEARRTAGYERFARALVGAAREADPTRPVIENDWVEPDPGLVFAGDVLTAHWYGRLHADYLDKIDEDSRAWSGIDKPLFITEFGDWGLPEMPLVADPPFWDTRETYAAGLAGTVWPGTVGRFVAETQRYQGLSDRLQAEVFRRHDHLGGYCVTELTDVPHELNGLLDLHRRPKPIAVAELRRANQTVLPMLRLESLVVVAGDLLWVPLVVANDGGSLEEVEVDVRFGGAAAPVPVEVLLQMDGSDLPAAAALARFGESAHAVRIGRVEGFRASPAGQVGLVAPDVPGSHDLVLRLRSAGVLISENRYPIHVVPAPQAGAEVQLVGGGTTADALAAVGASVGGGSLTVVAEHALDEAAGEEVQGRLSRGGTVLVLAQPVEHAAHFPLPTTLDAVETAWGSSVFHFTTDHGALPSLPRRNVLVAEDSTIQARSVVAAIGGRPYPDTPVVVAYKPVPGAMTGTVVGATAVGAGRLVFCQYRVCDRAAKGDAAARALLADLVRWGGIPRQVLRSRATTMADGRSSTSYSFEAGVGR